MRKKSKIQRKIGDVVRVDLGDGSFAFGQLLPSPLIAFFGLRCFQVPPLDEIVSSNVIFSIWVMNYAITDGEWPIVGGGDISPSINQRPRFFKKDAITGALSITYTGAEREFATIEEVKDLECAAVWDPNQVVARLNDYFSGRPNKWVESMKPRLK